MAKGINQECDFDLSLFEYCLRRLRYRDDRQMST